MGLLDDYAEACRQHGVSGRDFRLLADKAYAHPSRRIELRCRRIRHTILEPSAAIRSLAAGPTRRLRVDHRHSTPRYLGTVLLACAVIHSRVGATKSGDPP
jgi:transposase